MKNSTLILPLFLGLFLFSCGDTDSGDAEGTEGEEGGIAETPAKIETSAEMEAFLGSFDGDYEAVEAGLALYGASDDIVNHEMGDYDLAEPKVTAKNGECYTVTCKFGMVENTYEICWEEGEITSITGG
ncbi:MAG: hypothetical protein HRT57_11840 [Crocinitomicaceae bacterium]|nr:hypothetical protein [Crocinitomicaceae bacterium]